MSAPGTGLGRVFNTIAAASGIHIPLSNASAVSFITYLDAGTQVATIKESVNGASEQALDCNVTPFKGPGVGGTWTVMAEQDDTLSLATDATNDCMVFTVMAEDLSDGFNCVEVTVDGGICIAVIHDLKVSRYPANLKSSLVA
jgi:hypothetical protein